MAKIVCDPSPSIENISHYVLRGLLPDPVEVPSDPTGEYGFIYDLDVNRIAGGAYTVSAMACNERCCSIESIPLDFTLQELPSQPTGLRLSY